MASRGGQPRQLTVGPRNARSSWSHDGRWIYFTSNRTGRIEVWKVPASGGTATQVSRNGGANPLESEDGVAIYYTRGGAIWKAALDGSGEAKVVDDALLTGDFALTHDGMYYRARNPNPGVRFFSFASGISRPILKVNPSGYLGASVSPDGHWFLYPQVDTQAGSDLMLVENFN
jgi:hypothetical protein